MCVCVCVCDDGGILVPTTTFTLLHSLPGPDPRPTVRQAAQDRPGVVAWMFGDIFPDLLHWSIVPDFDTRLVFCAGLCSRTFCTGENSMVRSVGV